MQASASKEVRQRGIMALLMEKTRMKKKDIAYRFECNERTIQRDMDELRAREIPILSDIDGYYLDEPSKGQAQLSQNKMLGVLTLAGCAIDKNFNDFAPEVSERIKREYLDYADLPLHWNIHNKAALPSHTQLKAKDLENFGKLARFILNGHATAFHYTAISKEHALPREVFPVQLREREGSWYLLAYDYVKEAQRIFSLTRITGVSLSSEHRESPSAETIEQIMQMGQFSIWDNSPEEAEEVRIKLYGYAAWIIQEQMLHPSQSLEILSKDEVVLTLKTSDFIGLRLWMRKFAPDVEVLSPLKLRESFRGDLLAALKRNGTI